MPRNSQTENDHNSFCQPKRSAVITRSREARGTQGSNNSSSVRHPTKSVDDEKLFCRKLFRAGGRRVLIARKFLISGEVQGVGYRFFAQRAAARHQVVGYVRNLQDGRVEALAEGESASVEAFLHDLATGPAWASVANVEEINLEPTGTYSSFRIER
ncbi:MAG: acylphosphatase [Pyrinomonadaceae bacterium]|nr:acylphosphatase [Pyrinomonadaceae bacterium]